MGEYRTVLMSDGSFNDLGDVSGKEGLFSGSCYRRYWELLRRVRMVGMWAPLRR
jgi:hypothetical protein